MSSTVQRRKRIMWVWAAVAVAVLAVAAIVVFVVLPATTATAPPSGSATGEVGEDGFRLQLDGVVVEGGPDVAAAGTTVTARLIDQDVPGDFGTFATPVVPVVDITLGEELQPASPMTVTFTFDEEQAQSLQTDRLFPLGDSATEGREVDFVDGVWDSAERTMTVTVDHLSWYTVTHVDDDKLGEQVGEWINQQMAVRTPKPGCVDAPIPPEGSYVLSDPWPDAAWVCATETTGAVTMTLQSNSGLVYEILSRPAGTYSKPGGLTASGLATAYVARLVEEGGNALEGDGVLLAGATTDITYDKPFESAYIEIRIEPALSQVSAIVSGTTMLLPAGVQDVLGRADCLGAGLEAVAGGNVAQTIFSCVSAGVGGTAGGLLSILATGPGMLFSQIEGAAKMWTGENVEGFTVYLVADDAIRELPSGASWLYEHRTRGDSTSGEPDIANLSRGGDTVASYPFSTNQWVACNGRGPTQATYALNGEWETLSYALALQAHTPPDVTATVDIAGDGAVLYSGPISPGDEPERVKMDVTGVQELVVSAHTDVSCGSARKGYGALVQAYLE